MHGRPLAIHSLTDSAAVGRASCGNRKRDVNIAATAVRVGVYWNSCPVIQLLIGGSLSSVALISFTVADPVAFSALTLLVGRQEGHRSSSAATGEKLWQPTAGFMTHVTCRLTAKKRDQLRNPTLGNRVRTTFTFILTCARKPT